MENADAQVGVDYMATDPEDDNATLTWLLSGVDSARFAIGNTDSDRGALTFKSSPDFEAPSDRGGNNEYNVTVTITDSSDNTDSRNVTVTIDNVEEPQSVVLLFDSVRPETLMRQAEVGTRIRAKLIDPDKPASVTWEWKLGGNIIDGATSPTYTPTTHTGGNLQATATYTNIDGTDSNTPDSTPIQVQAEPVDNQRPVFTNPSRTLTASESATNGNDVGLPVIATDQENSDQLSYTLGGRNVGLFTIDATTAQISVKAGD